jgi:glycosyltransferase involved in cell wall biosynthesis
VSRHHTQKNIKLFINGFSLIHKKIDNWKVIVIGSGILMNQHKRLTKKLKLQEKFSWISQSRNISEYYEKSKIFCLPSIFEGVSNALLEAIKFDLSCVVSDSAISEKDYINNFIIKFKNKSETDLAEKLYKAINNPKKNVIKNKQILDFQNLHQHSCKKEYFQKMIISIILKIPNFMNIYMQRKKFLKKLEKNLLTTLLRKSFPFLKSI